jgi:uncharacterized membrane protein
LHVHAAYSCCIPTLNAHAAFLYCMSILHVLAACPCLFCISMLHAHVASQPPHLARYCPPPFPVLTPWTHPLACTPLTPHTYCM